MGAKFLVRVALLLIVAANAFPGVVAAESVPGDACSPANISLLSGGPETSGKVYLMTCQSGAWVRIVETDTSGNVGIGTATPRTSLDLGGKTDALVLQTGTTAQRPASPVEGMIRYNSTTFAMEGYVNGAWRKFQMVECQTVGQVCLDGSIYAGLSPDGNVPMYTTPCDAGQYWDGSTCAVCASGLWSGSGTTCSTTYSSRTDGLATWNNGTSNWTTTGYTSAVTGKGNTAGLAGLADAGSPHNAASYCENLTAYGNSDWYLPASDELSVLYTNRTAIGNFDLGSFYWSSSEISNTGALLWSFVNGSQVNTDKSAFLSVRCARR